MKNYCTYMMVNQRHTVLYTGVTNHLAYRVWQHKTKQSPKNFTARYNVDKLVFYSWNESIEDAILYEKQIKKFSRRRKEQLIVEMNPQWKVLSDEIGIQDILEPLSATPVKVTGLRRCIPHQTPHDFARNDTLIFLL